MFYDSLHDPNLQTYFEKKNIQKHLRKVGFINRHGEIVSEKEFQSNIQQQQRQKQIRAMLSHGIAQKVIQLERTREANFKNQFEFTKKLISVENIREPKQKPRKLTQKDLILFDQPINNQTDYSTVSQTKPKKESKLKSRRFKSRHSSKSQNRHQLIVHSNDNNQDLIEITMIYLSNQKKIVETNQTSEVMIMQQHCGAQNICVFKNHLKSNDQFTFKSYRQKSYPFALTLYVDGIIDSRISVCCEYKHKLNVPLGSKSASFIIINVQGGRPCQTCRFNEYLSSKEDQLSFTNQTLQSQITDQLSINDNQTNISNEIDEKEEARKLYMEIENKIDENLLNKQNGYYHYQLGNICKEGLNDPDLALEHYLNSLEIFLLFYLPNNCQLRNLYLNISHLFILKNQYHLAIEYLKRILDIDYSFKHLNYLNLINIHNYLALLYFHLNKYQKCLYHLNKCLLFYSNLHFKSNRNQLNENILISQTKYDQKALKCLSIDQIPQLSQIHYLFSIIYEKLNDQFNSFEHIHQAIQLETSDQNQLSIFQNHLQHLKNKFQN